MINRSVTLINKLGLHARAANKLLDVTCKFESDITLEFQGKKANGKSIMSVMLLAAPVGSEIDLSINGKDEEALFDAISTLINDRFGEGE